MHWRQLHDCEVPCWARFRHQCVWQWRLDGAACYVFLRICRHCTVSYFSVSMVFSLYSLELGQFGYNSRCQMFRVFRQKKSNVQCRYQCSTCTAACAVVAGCPVVRPVHPLVWVVSFTFFAGGSGTVVAAAMSALLPDLWHSVYDRPTAPM